MIIKVKLINLALKRNALKTAYISNKSQQKKKKNIGEKNLTLM